MKIALAGATGSLGVPLLKHFLAAGYTVVVLTREGSDSASNLTQTSNMVIAQVDYHSVPSVVSALRGVQVVISILTSRAAGNQNPLIDASIDAGVSRFIPSEFGNDTTNSYIAKLPFYSAKVATQKCLKGKAQSNPDFSYTLFFTGAFLEWGSKSESKLILQSTRQPCLRVAIELSARLLSRRSVRAWWVWFSTSLRRRTRRS